MRRNTPFNQPLVSILLVAASLTAAGVAVFGAIGPAAAESRSIERVIERSPVDLALSPDQRWVVTANQTSDSVSLVEVESGAVRDELAVGQHPVDIQFCPDGDHLLVSCAWSATVHVLRIDGVRLEQVAEIEVGYEPHGMAIASQGDRAYISLVASGQIAEVDWRQGVLVRRFDVGNWPRYLTLSPDDSRLAVGCSGDGKIVVVDTATGEALYEEPLPYGINLGHMLASDDGAYAYFTFMVYRTNPINVSNIRRGWVLASRIGRVRLDGPSYREAISLDVPRKAVADPWGLVISDDGQRLVASAAGTHELLLYRLPDLPFVGAGGPGDLIDRGLERDRDRFDRIAVGGRPMGLAMADDNRTVFVANYLRNSIQLVDAGDKQLVSEITLGPSEMTIARKGMEVFYDGTRSLDQWYSCHSCHQDGGINSRPMDTMNDGSERTLKTVLPLYDVDRTAPWTWHGWQDDLDDALHKSFTSTMQGPPPSEQDKRALIAFLQTLRRPPNPFLVDGQLSEAADRGKAVFESAKAGCIDCHSGPFYSDGQIHDVGLGSPDDYYQGYNTPSLLGAYRKLRLLHSGRAKSLHRVVTDLHKPERVNGEGGLNEQEVADLIEYLKSL